MFEYSPLDLKNIIFQGWYKNNNSWVCGDLNINKDGVFITEQNKDFMLTLSYEVAPDSVGLYTGHNDCNNLKIFSGDLVKDEDGDVYVVEFSFDLGFFLKLLDDDIDRIYSFPFSSKLEKIGNIYLRR